MRANRTAIDARQRRAHVRDESICPTEPTRATEFEVQATVWHGLRSLGINARGEVAVQFSGRQKVRFDIAVFADGALVGVIEIKASPTKDIDAWKGTRQSVRYSQFGVPVRIVCGMDQARALLHDAARGALWVEPP